MKQMRYNTTWFGCAFAALLSSSIVVSAAEREVHPVYVGSRVCASCHSGKQMGHIFSKWFHTKHAKAYASLSKPEAKEIAKLSGIPQEPQEAAMCLGCHATGAQAEEWEKDPSFHLEDGVQCERCHGPGSEYMDEKIMINRFRAVQAGLMIPEEKDCMNCHKTKGSHTAVHDLPKIDVKKALKRISHPTPENWNYRETKLKLEKTAKGPRYIGVMKCAECHKGPMMGYSFSKWRLGPHAGAYITLATDNAYTIAKEKGVKGEPQQSAECLQCHTTAYHKETSGACAGYTIDEGVGCEACHGAGEEYATEAVMFDPRASERFGLKPVDEKTCDRCHNGYHGKTFDYAGGKKIIAHPKKTPETVLGPQYKTPLNMAISRDGTELYIACEASHSVIVVDTVKGKKKAEIPTGQQPNDVTFHPDGKTVYVSNRLDDTISLIDRATQKVVKTVQVGDEPHGVLLDGRGRHLYVLNTCSYSISVLDSTTLEEVKRLTAGRQPWSLAMSPDKKKITVTNNLPQFVEFRTPPESEVTVIDTERAIVTDRFTVPAANLLQGIDWHPSGEFAFLTMNRTKNLVPMTRLLQGWTITNGLAVIWKSGEIDQVLLDEPGMYFPDPTDLAFTPDGKYALVTGSGSDRVAVVDVHKLISMLQSATGYERREILPDHLGKPVEFVIKHIKVKNSPRGIVVDPQGKFAYTANALDDSVSVIDLEKMEAVRRIDLGGPKVITKTRYGERLFHSAGITFRRQFSCHTCHPDGHINGLVFDIEPDGIGLNPVDNRTLRGILDTAPFKWEGTNPSLSRQCGPRLAVFFTRIQPYTPEELSALDRYICTIPRPPNRYRPVGAELTEAQRRGKKVFERTRSNDGRTIPKENRCSTCHFPPVFTDRNRHIIGEMFWLDYEDSFDVPHLNNIYDSPPYLHNGIAKTLEEIWTLYNPDDQHGVTNDMTKDQLNDLIEYIKTL